jgi:hypothetical protein
VVAEEMEKPTLEEAAVVLLIQEVQVGMAVLAL